MPDLTGRREDRLRRLAEELPGLSTVYLDISDIGTLPRAFSTIFQDHPDLDTVIVSAGIQSYFSIKEGSSSSPSKIQSEFDINLTAPAVISHLLIPHFLQREDNNNASSICFIGSGLAFVPLPLMSIYCASKAGLHSLCVSLRAELDGTRVSIVEICPPYVETELDKSFRDEMIARHQSQCL